MAKGFLWMGMAILNVVLASVTQLYFSLWVALYCGILACVYFHKATRRER